MHTTVLNALVDGRAVGSVGALGDLGIVRVALSGFDSPLLFFRKMVNGYFFPSIEDFNGTSMTALLPTTSPSSSEPFFIPKEGLSR